jgi:hypothetical protein
MNKIEKSLVEKLTPILAEAGFKWIMGRAIFLRKESYGFSSFSWASYQTMVDGGQIELVPLLAVRHNIVEDVVNELGLIHGESNKNFSATVDRGLGFFPFKNGEDEKQYIRILSPDLDIDNVAANVALIINGDGKNFFEKYSSLFDCSQGLNHPVESKDHPLCNNFPRRAYCGVAAAFFAENSRVHDLVSQYVEFSKKILPSQADRIANRLEQLIAAAEARRQHL